MCMFEAARLCPWIMPLTPSNAIITKMVIFLGAVPTIVGSSKFMFKYTLEEVGLSAIIGASTVVCYCNTVGTHPR